jgi:hypothetical protein
MSEKKPEPLAGKPTPGQVCPVCHQRSYSRNGIHPQCAVRQADAPRREKLAEQKRQERELALQNK